MKHAASLSLVPQFLQLPPGFQELLAALVKHVFPEVFYAAQLTRRWGVLVSCGVARLKFHSFLSSGTRAVQHSVDGSSDVSRPRLRGLESQVNAGIQGPLWPVLTFYTTRILSSVLLSSNF